MSTSTGPTLNPEYNFYLGRWTAQRAEGAPPALPECEACGKDMTDAEVVEGSYGWYCSCGCRDEVEDAIAARPSFEESARAERRMMGIEY